MLVKFVNAQGGGFAESVNVEEQTTVEQLFRRQVPTANPSQYHIRVNGTAVPSGYALREGDVVTMTALKVEGGC